MSYNENPRAAWVQGRCLESSEAQAVRVLALSIVFEFVPLWHKVATLEITSSHNCCIPNGNFSPNSLIVLGGWNPTSSPLADFPYVSGGKKKKACHELKVGKIFHSVL